MNNSQAYIQNGKLSEENRLYYTKYGYLVAEALLSAEEIAELRAETAAIFRGNRGHIDGLLEVDGLNNEEVLRKYVAIHFPHKISPLILRYLAHPAVVEVLTGIVSPNVKCMQSMLFVKAPGKAGQSWHQDEYYIPTRDKSLVGAWIAIDNATVENGCLWIIPGSNRTGYIMRRVPNDNSEYADVDTVDISTYSEEQVIPVEVKSGSVVFFN